MWELPAILRGLDLASVVVFAITGALVASRKQMDIVGFLWLGVVTGVGGGTVRDLLLGVPVFWVIDATPLVLCLTTAAVVHFSAHFVASRYRLLLYLDAFGMALVAIAGTAKGLDAGVVPLVALVMGVITAAVGGDLAGSAWRGAIDPVAQGYLCLGRHGGLPAFPAVADGRGAAALGDGLRDHCGIRPAVSGHLV